MNKTKPKFTLTVNPTFKAPVQIPVAGGGSAEIVMTFKHRTRSEFKEFHDSLQVPEGAEPVKDVDALMDVASGWDLDEPFDRENLEKMVQRFMGSAEAILHVYFAELTGARAKN